MPNMIDFSRTETSGTIALYLMKPDSLKDKLSRLQQQQGAHRTRGTFKAKYLPVMLSERSILYI
jgi:hypothetical protein